MIRPQKGFTLMELLIVIGVLGILAAGLLAAIDPFEQLKKARDTNNRSAAIELLSASQRYYATHGVLPWYTLGTYCASLTQINDTLAATTAAVPVGVAGTGVTPTAANGCVTDTLMSEGEVKATFLQGLAVNLYVTSGGSTRVGVCFAPESRANRADSQTRFNLTGTGDTFEINEGCSIAQRNAGSCLQCFE